MIAQSARVMPSPPRTRRTPAREDVRRMLESLFEAHHDAVYRYCTRMLRNSERGAEVTQEVFLKAYIALPRVMGDDDFRAQNWLYRIASNACLDELRHTALIKWQPWETFLSAFHVGQVDRADPAREALSKETRDETLALIQRLPPLQRSALTLREFDQLSYNEIADVLNTTRPAVKALVFRGRRELRYLISRRHPHIALALHPEVGSG